ncbi:MAG: flagellar biosynthesis anti-sigma factor FlgM [Pirellulales bacterium]|nr:flagellar biosynthesis anti-sigma factor FlgM [Pirellulales bacterium]
MQIYGPSQVHSPQNVNAPTASNRLQGNAGTQGTAASRSVDRVEISPAAQAASQAAESGGIRHELVNQIRSQIAAGTYETPEKLDAALTRLLDEIG